MGKRELKVQEVKNMSDRLEKAKAFIFAGYRGLKVADVTDLRKDLHKNESWMKVMKNRLIKRVLADKGMDDLSEFVTDPTAVVAAETDPAALAKLLSKFAKDHKALDLRGGYVEGKKVNKKDLEMISQLPSKEELYAKALSSMLAPANNLVGVLAALPRNLVCALNAIKEKKSA